MIQLLFFSFVVGLIIGLFIAAGIVFVRAIINGSRGFLITLVALPCLVFAVLFLIVVLQ